MAERTFGENELIVSKTDTVGKITYGNDLFIEMSGYSEHELLGSPHNMIRHPEMPRVIFKLLWDTIKAGKEISAYVVNLAKNGDHYWVLANVTPSFDSSGRVVGYYSVRRKPKKSALDFIVPLYKQLLDAEKRSGIESSLSMVQELLKNKGVSYDEFILSV